VPPAVRGHLGVAVGALGALQALFAILDQNWEAVYAWLGLGLLVELYEGVSRQQQIAAFVDTNPSTDQNASDGGPSIAFVVVTFLNSVFVPIFLLVYAGFLEGPVGLVIAALVLWSAQYHLTFHRWGQMPAAYVGFPAAWNLVAFYLHAFDATPIGPTRCGSGVGPMSGEWLSSFG
jgi:phosphatidylcholine synthase